MEKVTALVPAGNEEHNIREAIESLLWADEVYVVVDDSSTDATFEIASSFGGKVRVERHEYVYSAKQKNWAIPRASHEWVFLMDADERPVPELVEAIKRELPSPKKGAYEVMRKNLFLGRVMRFGGLHNDKVIRLFRKECFYQDRRVHAEIEGFASLGRLKGYLTHDTFRDWNSYLIKLHRYSKWGAEQAFKEGKNAGFVNVVLRPVHRFLKQYVIRLGFLDGIPGAVNAYLGAYSAFLKYTLLHELKRGRKEKMEGEIFKDK